MIKDAAHAAVLPESSRAVSIRYFNLYRVVVASAFAIFGAAFELGETAPAIFRSVIAVYWVLAILFAMTPAQVQHKPVALFVQVAVDILVLTVLMYLSGGSRSGIPYLMMATIAGAALVSQGRMVTGFAAMATIGVLAEQIFRVLTGSENGGDFTRTGMTGVGYFAVAMLARLLARRALANEALAKQRGQDLDRQLRVNAHIIRDMQDGVVVLDAEGVVRQTNPAAWDLLGNSLQEGLDLSGVSASLFDLLHSSDANGMPVFRAEATGRSLRLRRVATEADHGCILYLEDMDRVQAQAQQIKLAALGRLTANIAHEIRNPLSSISHANELMAEEKRADMLVRLHRIVRDNAARIELIVRNVLELGRRDRSTPEALDLHSLLPLFIDDIALTDASVHARVRLEIEGSASILFDRLHLHQILSNIVGNALRYASQAPAAVRLRVFEAEGGVIIAVKDDGPGIAAADQAKLFEPFFTSDPQGNGLGLYIARELAEANGARLLLAGVEGGAEFQLFARSST